MRIRDILETYETSCKINDNTLNIYSNPTKKEIREVAEEIDGNEHIRFIISPLRETVYILPPSLLHGIAIKKIFKDCGVKIGVGKSMLGTATLKNNKWIINKEETKGPNKDEAKEKLQVFINKIFLSY